VKQHTVTIVRPNGYVSTVPLNPVSGSLPEDYIADAVKSLRRANGGADLPLPLTIHYSESE
jgi:hypothetical protein